MTTDKEVKQDSICMPHVDLWVLAIEQRAVPDIIVELMAKVLK